MRAILDKISTRVPGVLRELGDQHNSIVLFRSDREKDEGQEKIVRIRFVVDLRWGH